MATLILFEPAMARTVADWAVSPEEEAVFNVGQPREYVWMRLER